MSDPERIDRYEVRGILGHGAMGHVYLAWDPKLHREVALKVVAKNLTRDAKGRQRFHREARAIAALKHPNIVEIYDYSGEDSSDLYLVMEKLDGDDLFNIMNDKGMAPEAAAAAVGHELCLALSVAHESGIIHRDIKPENVFMNAAGRVILTDFGVVKAIREGSAVDGWSAETDVIGTPGFMAPELMMNRALGPRTDIFALGALLYNITTADMPFAGESPVEIFRNVVAFRMNDPRGFNPTLSEEFVEVLSGCLQAKPKKRFRSAEQVRERLKAVLELNGVSDLRDDLRDYMRDPAQYSTMAKQRAVGYLVDKLKVSLKDHDEATERRIRKRLMIVDPNNREIRDITGMRQSLDPSLRIPVRESARNGSSPAGYAGARWLYAVVGVVVTVAVVMASYLAWRSSYPAEGSSAPIVEDANAQAESAAVDSAPAESAKGAATASDHDRKQPRAHGLDSTRVSVKIKGGRGAIYLDGKPLGRHRSFMFKRDPGTYRLEIRGNRRKLKKTLTLNGEPLKVLADLRCRRRNCITVE
ncbi:MAG: serine/threonine-protein kinase [Myxococcota bacterium]